MRLKILAVDDEEAITYTIREGLKDQDVNTCADPMRAISLAEKTAFDILIVDYKMPGMNGLELLRELKDMLPRARGILLTAYANKDILEQAIRQRLLFQVIEKPITIQELQKVIVAARQDILEERRQEAEVLALKDENEKLRYFFDRKTKVIGIEKGLKKTYEQIAKVSPQSMNVLLTGETGTGKEVLADLIHEMSPRKNGPLVKINCAAIPDNLLESELFGYEKGAFTGAEEAKPGFIEQASGGTLFLDEIGDLKAEVQSKFLRVLQDRRVFRLGSTSGKKVDFRLVSATNRDLETAMEEHSFRMDLYYRISGFTVSIPPLRERLEDIPALVEYFTKKGQIFQNLPDLPFSPGAIEALKTHSWPGNIRELENVVYRSVLHARRGEIREGDLDFSFSGRKKTDSLEQSLDFLMQGLMEKKWNLEFINKSLVHMLMEHFDDGIDAVLKNSSLTKDELIKYLRQ